MNTQKIRQGYKKTEIGVIPKDWDVKKIGEFSYSTAGGTPNTQISKYWGGSIRWMSSGELNDKVIYEVEGRITEEGLKNSSTKNVPAKSVLIGLAGQGKTRGTVAISKVDLCTNQSIAAILPSESFDPEYLYFNLDSRYDELRSLSTGGEGRGGLNLSIIRSVLVPVPQKGEQIVISRTLSDIDHLINLLNHTITKKQNIKNGTVQLLFSGKKRLNGFTGKWRKIKLGDVADFYKGKGLPKSELVQDGKYKCIHYGELFTTYQEKIDSILSSTDREDDVFLSKSNDVLMPTSDVTPTGLARASCLNYGGVVLGGDILIIRPRPLTIDGVFLSYNIRKNKNQIMQLVTGSTVYHIYASDMREYEFLAPPTFEEQEAIASTLLDMDVEIKNLEKQLHKTRELKQGMMQQLLSGNIRLI